MHYILDACALLAFLNDEDGADIAQIVLDVIAKNEPIPILWFR